MTDPTRREQTASAQADQRLELVIAMLLRIGVAAAALLVAAGGILALRHPDLPAPSYSVFHAPGTPEAATAGHVAIHSITSIFRNLKDGSGLSIIALGLLVLIATPIARVVFALVGFARERDALYTVISLLVLAILIFSLVHGR